MEHTTTNLSRRPRIRPEKSQQSPANKANESSLNSSDINAYLADDRLDRIEAKIDDLSYEKFCQIDEKMESS